MWLVLLERKPRCSSRRSYIWNYLYVLLLTPLTKYTLFCLRKVILNFFLYWTLARLFVELNLFCKPVVIICLIFSCRFVCISFNCWFSSHCCTSRSQQPWIFKPAFASRFLFSFILSVYRVSHLPKFLIPSSRSFSW